MANHHSYVGQDNKRKTLQILTILKVEIFEVLTGKEASKRKKNLAKYQVKKHLRLKMEPTCVL